MRVLLILKCLLQIIGIVISSIAISFDPSVEMGVVGLFAMPFLLIPELIMGLALWISKGVSSIKNARDPSDRPIVTVPVFGETVMRLSFYFYVVILMSIALLLGGFLETPILYSGMTLFGCLIWHKELRGFSDRYLYLITQRDL